MNILIIPDKFKGSLTAQQAIDSIRLGLEDQSRNIQSHSIIASDGGDGFLSAVRRSDSSIKIISCLSTDPLGRPIDATYGFRESDSVAFVEMAKASGMELLQRNELDPSETTTFGTGQLIANAIEIGATKVFVGLGGSATNDGGTGIAAAMGLSFLDEFGAKIPATGGGLARLDRIVSDLSLEGVEIFAINDVQNPLLGPEGASHVYGPQKGADSAMVKRLEANLSKLSDIVKRDLKIDASSTPGTGAAGGTGYGLHVFLNARFLSGIDFVLSLAGVESLLAKGGFDLIITGEGRIDDQTAYGKLVRGVASVGKKHGVPVLAVCGLCSLESMTADDIGVRKIFQLHDDSRSVEETIKKASSLLRKAMANLDLSICESP
ncbi:MAG: glycerate kinase [Planctomycetota bacterium]